MTGSSEMDASPGEPVVNRGGAIAVALVLGYALLATLSIARTFEQHAATYALIQVEGYACLESDPSPFDLPAAALAGRDVGWFIPGITAMYRLLDDVLALSPEGVQWTTYLSGVAWTCLAALLLFGLARRMLGSPRAALLALGLFLAAPFTFAVTAHWQQSPTFLLLLLSLEFLRRCRYLLFLGLTLVAALFHPVILMTSLGFAWAATRPVRGDDDHLLGLPDGGDEARRWHRGTATALLVILALQCSWLVVRATGGGTSLTWYFVLRKLMFSTHEQILNLPTHIVFFAPFLFLPLVTRRMWPVLAPLVAYVVVGSQGLVTATAGHYQGVTFLAWLAAVSRLGPTWRGRATVLGLVVSLALHLLVPWNVVLPVWHRDRGGSPLNADTWRVPDHETAIDATVEAHVPPGTTTCLTNYELVPLLNRSCQRTTPITYPARMERYDLSHFLGGDGARRLASGDWERVILDTERLADDPALPALLQALDARPNLTPLEAPAGIVAYRRSSHRQRPPTRRERRTVIRLNPAAIVPY